MSKEKIVKAGAPAGNKNAAGPHGGHGSVSEQAESYSHAIETGEVARSVSHGPTVEEAHKEAAELHTKAAEETKNLGRGISKYHKEMAAYHTAKANGVKAECPIRPSGFVKAAGSTAGAMKGNATKKTDAASTASQAAHAASATAHDTDTDADHAAAGTAHDAASEAHSTAMVANAKAGQTDQANEHAKLMSLHDRMACFHKDGTHEDAEGVQAADTEELGKFVQAGAPMGNKNAAGPHNRSGSGPTAKANRASDAASEAEKSGKDADEISSLHEDAADAHLHALSENNRTDGPEKISDYHMAQRRYHYAQAEKWGRIAEKNDANAEGVQATDREEIGIVSANESTVEFDPALPTSEFMWMPAGQHMIQASYDGKPARLCVNCQPTRDTGVVKASFTRICGNSQNRPPFGDINHKEVEAAFWPKDFVAAEDGIYCKAEWTELGLKCVRGKTFRSFSPCFSCDADWVKAVDNGNGVLVFPEGVRGSASNPAKVTGVSPKSVGSLTNWPAFKAILPVKAEQAEPKLETTKPAEQVENQNTNMKTKIKFVQASSDGKHAAGAVVELDAEVAAPYVQAGEAAEPAIADRVISLNAEAGRQAVKTTEASKKLVKSAIVRAVERGALPKGKDGAESAEASAAFVKAEGYLKNGVPICDVCDIIDSMPAVVKAKETGKAGLFVRATESGERVVGVAVGMETVEETCQGILKAYDPMISSVNGAPGLVKAGRIDEAILASREIANLYKTGILPILEKGGDFAVKDLVRAGDTADPNGQLGTISTGILLMRDLGYLKSKLIPMDICTTDISAEPVKFNQQIITRYKTPPNVLSWKKGVGYTANASDTVRTTSTPSTTDVPINMAQNKAVCVQFDNQLLGSTMRNLFGEQQPMEFYALALAINQHVISTLLAYAWAPKTASGASLNPPKFNANQWNIPSLVTIKNKMTLAQIPDDAGERKVLLHSFFHDILLQDANLLTAYVIKAALAAQSNPSLTNFAQTDLPTLFGLQVTESQLFSDTPYADTGWQPTTFGFAGTKSASLFVSRIPNDYATALGDVPATAAIQVVTEPDSNLSMLFSKWVDNGAKVTNAECALMYQCAGGDPRQGMLLQTNGGAQN